MASTSASRHPRTVAPSSTTTRGTTRLYSLPWSMATTSSGGWRWEQVVQVLMPRFGTRAVWKRNEPLPHDDRDIPYFVIGDAAFALRTTLMKPFGAKPLTMEERIFNYRLSRARRCVEIPVFSECYGTGAFHSGDHRPRLPVHPQPPERPGTRWAECHDGQRGRTAQHHPGCMERGGRAGWHATEACWQLHHQDCHAPAPVPQALLQWHRRSSSLAAAHGLR